MKRFFLFALLIPSVLFAVEEQWKGAPYTHRFDVGGMTGVGILNGTAGFEMRGVAAIKMLHTGFFPDINNQVYLEAQPGLLFVLGSTAFTYSVHLRWDFNKNEDWSFFAIGGFGGAATGSALGSQFQFYPRFGIGAMWNPFERVSFRAEVSHEFTGLGIIVLI